MAEMLVLATPMATFRTSIGTTVRSSSTGTTLATRTRTFVPVQKFQQERPEVFEGRFCIVRSQPRDILESSTKSSSTARYFFGTIIFSSYSIRMRCFKLSISTRIFPMHSIFLVSADRAASIPVLKSPRHTISISLWIP